MEKIIGKIEISSKLEKFLVFTTISAFIFLALGLTTSMTLLAGFHIFMIPSIVFFMTKANYKSYPKSAWIFLLFSFAIFSSILFNQDISVSGFKNIFKLKYFLIGFLSIAPVAWFTKEHMTKKHITIFLYILFISTTIGTMSGLIAKFYGVNPITMRVPYTPDRNSGMMGMVMNYAHNLSFVLILMSWLAVRKKTSEKYISYKFLMIVLIVNLVGLYFSYTRGAWLAFILALPLIFFNYFSVKKFLLVSILSSLVLVGGYFAAGDSVARSDNDMTRIGLWLASIEAFKERPLLGYGYLNFEPHSSQIKHKHNLPYPEFSGHAHNNFMEILATTGGIGFVLFCLWIGLWLREIAIGKQKNSTLLASLWVVFIVGGMTQATAALGINLFVIISIYLFSLVYRKESETLI